MHVDDLCLSEQPSFRPLAFPTRGLTSTEEPTYQLASTSGSGTAWGNTPDFLVYKLYNLSGQCRPLASSPKSTTLPGAIIQAQRWLPKFSRQRRTSTKHRDTLPPQTTLKTTPSSPVIYSCIRNHLWWLETTTLLGSQILKVRNSTCGLSLRHKAEASTGET